MPFGDITARLFGRRKPPAPEPSLQVRLRRAQTQVQNMEMRSDVLIQRVCDLEATARRKFAAGNRTGAALSLRQKKMIEGEHNRVQGQIINVTRSVLAMEQALASTATVDCLRGTASVLAVANAQHGDVDEVIEKFTEACDDTQDVAEQLAAPIGDMGGSYGDDDALLAEIGPEAPVVPAPAVTVAIAAPAPRPAETPVTAAALGMPEAPTGHISLEDEMKQLELEAGAA